MFSDLDGNWFKSARKVRVRSRVRQRNQLKEPSKPQELSQLDVRKYQKVRS